MEVTRSNVAELRHARNRSVMYMTVGVAISAAVAVAGGISTFMSALNGTWSRPAALVGAFGVSLGAIWTRYFWRQRRRVSHPVFGDCFKYLFDELVAIVYSVLLPSVILLAWAVIPPVLNINVVPADRMLAVILTCMAALAAWLTTIWLKTQCRDEKPDFRRSMFFFALITALTVALMTTLMRYSGTEFNTVNIATVGGALFSVLVTGFALGSS